MEDRIRPEILSGSTLKIIACISMLIDHTTLILWHRYSGYLSTLDYDVMQHYKYLYDIGRTIGRPAFPIFCFLIVEGYFHTRSKKLYLLRLIITAVLSEHAFNLLVAGQHFAIARQNVFLTLAISLITIWGMDIIRSGSLPLFPKQLLSLLAGSAGCLAAYFLKTDYSYHGVLSVITMFVLRDYLPLCCIGGALTFLWEPWGMTGFLPILLYNNKRGMKVKYFFYFFYPAHIYIVYLIVNYLLPPPPY